MFFKFLLALALATVASAASCNLKKIEYPLSYDLDTTEASQPKCEKGSQSMEATDYTAGFEGMAKKLLTKGVFPSLRGDDKDVYDCGKPGIKRIDVKGVYGCRKGKLFHGDVCVVRMHCLTEHAFAFAFASLFSLLYCVARMSSPNTIISLFSLGLSTGIRVQPASSHQVRFSSQC
jgi:hypothetical protein